MTFIETNFKTIQFALFFTDIDEKDTRVYRFLLQKMLSSHTKNYKTKKEMSIHLETLYGASVYTNVNLNANLSSLVFILSIVNPKTVNDPSLLDQSIDLLNQMFVDRTYFNEAIFEEEKRLLIEEWQALKDNKHAYANLKFQKHFYKPDLSQYPLPGELKDVKQATFEKFVSYYQEQFNHNDVKIIVNGDVASYKDKIESTLKIQTQDQKFDKTFGFRPFKKIEHIEEATQMNQAQLKLGYLLPVYRFDPLYTAALCLNMMVGGYPESRLFKEIREEKGLCYAISSQFNYFKGTLVISAGVTNDQRQFALDEIIKLIENLKNEGVLEDELEHAKSYLKHQLKTALDKQYFLTSNHFFKHLFDHHESIENRLKKINQVSIEDIKKVLDNLILDTTYQLYGGQND